MMIKYIKMFIQTKYYFFSAFDDSKMSWTLKIPELDIGEGFLS